MFVASLLLIILPAAFLAFVTKRRIEYFIATILPCWCIILFISGLFRLLYLSYCMIIALVTSMAAAMVVFSIFLYKKRRSDLLIRLKFIATPGAFICILGLIFSSYVSNGCIFYRWDEFSHWGKIAKVLFLYDTLPVMDQKISHLLTYPSYPVGVAMIQYLFSKFICGKELIESTVFFAMETLFVSTFSLFMVRTKWKDLGTSLIYFIAMFLMCASFNHFFFIVIYVDVLLGVVLSGTFFFLFAERGFQWFHAILMTLMSGFLIMVKASGAGLAVFAAAASAITGLSILIPCLIKRKFSKIVPIFSYFLPFAAFLMRLLHNYSIRAVKHNFPSKGISFRKLFNFFQYPTSEHFNRIYDRMCQSIFMKPIADFPIQVSYFTLSTIFCILIYIIASWYAPLQRRKIRIVSIVLGGGFFVYAFTLFVYYVFVFSAYEGERLASFDRYMSTYLIAEALVLIAVAFNATLKSFRLAVLASLTLLIPAMNCHAWNALSKYFSSDNYSGMMTYEVLFQYLEPYLQKNQKVFIISQGSQGKEYNVMSTKYLKNYHYTKSISWGKAPQRKGDVYSKEYSDQDIRDLLKKTDYCLLKERNQYFTDHYGKYFSDRATKHYSLYKCENGMFQRLPPKIFIFKFDRVSLLTVQKNKNACVQLLLKKKLLNIHLGKGGSLSIIPHIFCDSCLKSGSARKIVLHFTDIKGDAQYELRVKSSVAASGKISSAKPSISLDLPDISDFTFSLDVKTKLSETCTFSISRIELYFADQKKDKK